MEMPQTKNDSSNGSGSSKNWLTREIIRHSSPPLHSCIGRRSQEQKAAQKQTLEDTNKTVNFASA